MKSVLTTCPYCGTGCTLYLNILNDEIISVKPNNKASVNEGKLCLKGHFGFDFVHHKDRLTTPLVRKDGELVKTSWDEAIGVVASRLKELKYKYGPDSIAAFSSARCTNEENYLLQKMIRAVIGTNNIDHCARL